MSESGSNLRTRENERGDHASATEQNNELVISYLTLRTMVGLLALGFPFAVVCGNWLFFGHHVAACLWPSNALPGSLSGYYYTHMRNVFVGVLWAVGLFLLAYRGRNKLDNRVTNIAGLAAICISCFPTSPPSRGQLQFFNANACGSVTPVGYTSSLRYQALFGQLHLVFVVILFAMVTVMSLLFTEPPGSNAGPEGAALRQSFRARLRSWLLYWRTWWEELHRVLRYREEGWRSSLTYVVCAAVIAFSGVWAFITRDWSGAPWLLWCELVAFVFFGISWAVKGCGVCNQTGQRLRGFLGRITGQDGEPGLFGYHERDHQDLGATVAGPRR
jgi:hypothetical protein